MNLWEKYQTLHDVSEMTCEDCFMAGAITAKAILKKRLAEYFGNEKIEDFNRWFKQHDVICAV